MDKDKEATRSGNSRERKNSTGSNPKPNKEKPRVRKNKLAPTFSIAQIPTKETQNEKPSSSGASNSSARTNSTASTRSSTGTAQRREIKAKINQVREKFKKFSFHPDNNSALNSVNKEPSTSSGLKNGTLSSSRSNTPSSTCSEVPRKSKISKSEEARCWYSKNAMNFMRESTGTIPMQDEFSGNNSERSRSKSLSVDSQSSGVPNIGVVPKVFTHKNDPGTNQFNNVNRFAKPNRCEERGSICSNNGQSMSLSKKSTTRGKRGEKKRATKLTEHGRMDLLTAHLAANNLTLNAETLLILDLMSILPQDRDQFIINTAKNLKILITNEKGEYELNPKVSKLQSDKMLLNGYQLRSFGREIQRRGSEIPMKLRTTSGSERPDEMYKLAKGKEEQGDAKSKGKVRFEDILNKVIGDDIPEEKKKELEISFSRKQLDFESKVFHEKMEELAQKCVAWNLGVIVEGEIRINARNNGQAFMKLENRENDAIFLSSLGRQNAFHGDIVRAFIRNKQPVKDKEFPVKEEREEDTNLTIKTTISEEVGNENAEQVPNLDDSLTLLEEGPLERCSPAFVIKIVKKVHNRMCVGSFLSNTVTWASLTFTPRDTKLPNVTISKSTMPKEMLNNLESIPDTLYVVEITHFIRKTFFGRVVEPVGKCGELESENKAILLQNNLDVKPYAEHFNKMFEDEFVIPEDELKKREDIRSECVFTIDPLTARDLDDAVSCRELIDGNFEIGVHISDVSYFFQEDSDLDNIVKKRTTSVYLVNEVFHMLPKPLCLRCSLLPAKDKLAFSVFWMINPIGEVLKTRFARTVLSSCTQLAYEHAQKIIDYPDRSFDENDFPPIHNGYTIDDIVSRVRTLQEIAVHLRKKRFDSGALRINKPKISFELDPKTGKPVSYYEQVLKEANHLIEEFMLLANQSVAKFIYESFPNISILRNHSPPYADKMKVLRDRLKSSGVDLDVSSSKGLYTSMQQIMKISKDPELTSVCLAMLVSKPMLRARYFCSDFESLEQQCWHYALSIPIYTHFTSPIRRYPDVLVHRILSAALGYTEPPKRTPEELQIIANTCNDMKYNAKLAGDDSSDLYLMNYIQSKGSVIMEAAVLDVYEYTFELALMSTGHQIRLAFRDLGPNVEVKRQTPSKKDGPVIVTFVDVPDAHPVELKPFSRIWVAVTVPKRSIKARIIPFVGTSITDSQAQKLLNTPREKKRHKNKNDSENKNEGNSNEKDEKVSIDTEKRQENAGSTRHQEEKSDICEDTAGTCKIKENSKIDESCEGKETLDEEPHDGNKISEDNKSPENDEDSHNEKEILTEEKPREKKEVPEEINLDEIKEISSSDDDEPQETKTLSQDNASRDEMEIFQNQKPYDDKTLSNDVDLQDEIVPNLVPISDSKPNDDESTNKKDSQYYTGSKQATEEVLSKDLDIAEDTQKTNEEETAQIASD